MSESRKRYLEELRKNKIERFEKIQNNGLRNTKYRQYEDDMYFTNKVDELARKFGVSRDEILSLTNKFTVSEIEKARVVNGKIVCDDEIKVFRNNGWFVNQVACM